MAHLQTGKTMAVVGLQFELGGWGGVGCWGGRVLLYFLFQQRAGVPRTSSPLCSKSAENLGLGTVFQ